VTRVHTARARARGRRLDGCWRCHRPGDVRTYRPWPLAAAVEGPAPWEIRDKLVIACPPCWDRFVEVMVEGILASLYHAGVTSRPPG
jgi:hypothetical protein